LAVFDVTQCLAYLYQLAFNVVVPVADLLKDPQGFGQLLLGSTVLVVESCMQGTLDDVVDVDSELAKRNTSSVSSMMALCRSMSARRSASTFSLYC